MESVKVMSIRIDEEQRKEIRAAAMEDTRSLMDEIRYLLKVGLNTRTENELARESKPEHDGEAGA